MHAPQDRTRGLRHLVAAAGLLAAALAPHAAQGGERPKHEIKMATVAPENSTWMNVMRAIDTAVRTETGGEVGFKIYPGGVQGDEKVVLRKIRSGQLHAGGFTGLGLGLIAPECRVVELPFLFDNWQQVDAAYAAVGGQLESALQESGYTLLGWAEVGFVYLFSKQPIATQSDLRAAKMWLWEGDPMAESFYAAANVVPVPLAVTDVMTSLQTGLVNAVYSSPLGCLALQWFTRVSCYTDLPVTFASGAVVVSNDMFLKIPEAHRAAVLRICSEQFRGLVLKTRERNEESLREIEKAGVRRVPVGPDEIARFEQIGNQVREMQTGKLFSRDLVDAVRAAAAAPATDGAGARR
jgi:TRAP-type C4-dicarboxylate transport system substrate-binding protein